MKRIVLIFGLISGFLSSAMMFATVPFMKSNNFNYDRGEIVGYTAILLSFLLVFFGIRSYRENAGAGSVTFGRAFAVGILITIISSVFYVASWEVIYFNFMPDFMDKYATHTVQAARAKGKSEAEVAKTQHEMDEMKRLYKNPMMNFAMTFMEPFPVGLIVTLVSAAILRKRPNAPAVAAALA